MGCVYSYIEGLLVVYAVPGFIKNRRPVVCVLPRVLKPRANCALRLKICLMNGDTNYNHNNPIGQMLIILISIINLA